LEYLGTYNFTEIMDLFILGWTLHFTGARMVLFSYTTVNWWAPSSTPNSREDGLDRIGLDEIR
jgi:microsomal dipeptidase-like Zn-dependent dipeptidase